MYLSLFSRHCIIRLAAIFLFCAGPFTASKAANASTEDWKLASQEGGVTIYSRLRAGSTVKELKAVGRIDATPRAIMAVIDDVDAYPHFMPYVVECRVLKREPDSLVTYQRVAPPFCTNRDYSIRVRHETKSTPDGMEYLCQWELANALGPAESDNIVRVKINEGSWIIEPAPGDTSRVTYCIYTDSGGSLPAWLAGKANQIGIGKVFEAIRKQVKDAKYGAAR